MIISDICTKARNLALTDTTNYSDANLLIDLNIWYQKVASWILASQDDADYDDDNNTNYPIYTQAMNAAQRDYPIPQTMNTLELKRLDITYDGINWYRAIAIDDATEKRGQGPVSGATQQDATIDARFNVNSPRYDIKYGSLFTYPMATAAQVTAGATMIAEFTRQVCPFSVTNTDTPAGTGKLYVGSATLSNGTASPGFDAMFHPILAYGAASEFAQQNNMPILEGLLGKLSQYQEELKMHYGNKNRDFKLMLGSNDTPQNIHYR